MPYQGLSGRYNKVIYRKALTLCLQGVIFIYINNFIKESFMDYGIGLDIGIASVGWAIVALDEDARPYGLIDTNSRIFKKAENAKGESMARTRRMARSTRRILRRRALRKQDAYQLIEKNLGCSKEDLGQLFKEGHLEDIYALRTRALDEAVSETEFARILLHLMQRRGFKSTRRKEKTKDDGLLLQAVAENEQRMLDGGYRTVGEMFFKDPVYADHKRNKKKEYLATVSREEVESEAHLLFAAQREKGQKWATEDFENTYLGILLRQRSFDCGPGGNSPYAGGWEKKVGKCTLISTERRAYKNTYTFERSTLLQKINNIRLRDNGKRRALTDEERNKIIALAYRIQTVSYDRIRKELNLAEDVRFKEIHYKYGEDISVPEKKRKLPEMRGYHTLRKVFGTKTPDRDLWDEIITILGNNKDDDNRLNALKELPLTAEQIDALLELDFSGTGHISLKACRMIEPFLLQGMTYNEACAQAGLDFHGHGGKSKKNELPSDTQELRDLNNPVVKRAIHQTIRVINAIIKRMGKPPVYINVEMARELNKTFKQRMECQKKMLNNQHANETLMKEMRELGRINPTGQDLVKYRLWKEQNGTCPYSLQPIDVHRLFEKGYVEVDHIIPYSISFDDSRSNKVLVFARENRQKSDRLPLEYIRKDMQAQFAEWVKTNIKNPDKQGNLLKESICEDDLMDFRERNLQDTRYIAKFMLSFIQDYLAFADHPAKKDNSRRVTAVAGGITAYMRKRWNLSKCREDGDLHHAVDAIVIACITQGMVNEISRYCQYQESKTLYTDEGNYLAKTMDRRFPSPWPHFCDDIEQRLSENPKANLMYLNPRFYEEFGTENIHRVFVSRMANHKGSGAAHKDTIYSPKALDDDLTIVKTPLTKLKLNDNGEIADYYMPSSDRLLYEALKARLKEFDGNAKKAFADPFYKPKADGTQGPLVRSVKIMKKATITVPVNGGKGVARNSEMVRVDVYYVPDDGYYMVPIYIPDLLKDEVPRRAAVAAKSYEEWPEMKKEHFQFSLSINDVIKVTAAKDFELNCTNPKSSLPPKMKTNDLVCYFSAFNTATAGMDIKTHDNAYQKQGMGIKRLISIQKCCNLTVLGVAY